MVNLVQTSFAMTSSPHDCTFLCTLLYQEPQHCPYTMQTSSPQEQQRTIQDDKIMCLEHDDRIAVSADDHPSYDDTHVIDAILFGNTNSHHTSTKHAVTTDKVCTLGGCIGKLAFDVWDHVCSFLPLPFLISTMSRISKQHGIYVYHQSVSPWINQTVRLAYHPTYPIITQLQKHWRPFTSRIRNLCISMPLKKMMNSMTHHFDLQDLQFIHLIDQFLFKVAPQLVHLKLRFFLYPRPLAQYPFSKYFKSIYIMCSIPLCNVLMIPISPSDVSAPTTTTIYSDIAAPSSRHDHRAMLLQRRIPQEYPMRHVQMMELRDAVLEHGEHAKNSIIESWICGVENYAWDASLACFSGIQSLTVEIENDTRPRSLLLSILKRNMVTLQFLHVHSYNNNDWIHSVDGTTDLNKDATNHRNSNQAQSIHNGGDGTHNQWPMTAFGTNTVAATPATVPIWKLHYHVMTSMPQMRTMTVTLSHGFEYYRHIQENMPHLVILQINLLHYKEHWEVNHHGDGTPEIRYGTNYWNADLIRKLERMADQLPQPFYAIVKLYLYSKKQVMIPVGTLLRLFPRVQHIVVQDEYVKLDWRPAHDCLQRMEIANRVAHDASSVHTTTVIGHGDHVHHHHDGADKWYHAKSIHHNTISPPAIHMSESLLICAPPTTILGLNARYGTPLHHPITLFRTINNTCSFINQQEDANGATVMSSIHCDSGDDSDSNHHMDNVNQGQQTLSHNCSHHNHVEVQHGTVWKNNKSQMIIANTGSTHALHVQSFGYLHHYRMYNQWEHMAQSMPNLQSLTIQLANCRCTDGRYDVEGCSYHPYVSLVHSDKRDTIYGIVHIARAFPQLRELNVMHADFAPTFPYILQTSDAPHLQVLCIISPYFHDDEAMRLYLAMCTSRIPHVKLYYCSITALHQIKMPAHFCKNNVRDRHVESIEWTKHEQAVRTFIAARSDVEIEQWNRCALGRTLSHEDTTRSHKSSSHMYRWMHKRLPATLILPYQDVIGHHLATK